MMRACAFTRCGGNLRGHGLGIMRLSRAVGVALMCAVCGAWADVVKTGYFSGLDLVPMQGARFAQLEAEPAAVLIFAADANSADATTKFDQWFRDPNRPRVNVYAVSVGPEDTPFEVISEALRQRGMQVPTFHLRGGNLLQGHEYRLLVLDRGGQVRRELGNLDFGALNAALGAPAGAAVSSGSTITSSTTVSVDGGAALTPTPVPQGVTVEDVDSNEPIYYNRQFGITIQFPPGWNYRIARNGDGAVCKAPRGKLDLRVWAAPNNVNTDGSPGTMTPSEYIQQFTKSLGEQNGTEPNIERRYVVEDENSKGRDYMYTYARRNDPQNPAAETVRYRARMQVFDVNGTFKVASAEAPSPEFDAVNNAIIEPFFVSFHPRIQAPDGVPSRPNGTGPDGNSGSENAAPPAGGSSAVAPHKSY